ncbi:methyltransferase domain-containing protein [Diaphorobacter sp.]|uniref:methyltransferase domain-containing protein n=1 Tax=Diaphorobacter sp. TaxID=1934310 RepID=UPI0028B05060|nr:methyltransferase domain-containing protein [Diaphorobacter sp.]
MSASAKSNDPILKLLIAARQQITDGNLRDAALSLNQAQKIWPNDARIFILGAHMAEKSGNVEGAFTSLRRAVALAPNYSPAELELALLHSRQDQHDEAIRHAEVVREREPNNIIVLGHYIDIARQAMRADLAIPAIRRALELVPNDEMLMRLLATDLQRTGQKDEAFEYLNRLIELNPKDEGLLVARVKHYFKQERPTLALKDTNTLIELQPGNSTYAYYSAIANGVTPERQPEEMNRDIFDGMAETFDQHLVRGLGYQLPKIVAEKILRRFPNKSLSVLDLGCGTGLLGVCLGRLDGFLIGVDISKKMVEQAAKHGLYDRFHLVNIHDALRETPGDIYEVITALDVFIYIGDLKEAIPNALRILLPAGDLYFSCEAAPDDGPDLVLQGNGRYQHKRSHIQALCQQAGFESVEIEDMVLRSETGEPVNGFLVVARKAA